MTLHRILITAEYLNAHFFPVFLFVYAIQVLKALFYALKGFTFLVPAYPGCPGKEAVKK